MDIKLSIKLSKKGLEDILFPSGGKIEKIEVVQKGRSTHMVIDATLSSKDIERYLFGTGKSGVQLLTFSSGQQKNTPNRKRKSQSQKKEFQ